MNEEFIHATFGKGKCSQHTESFELSNPSVYKMNLFNNFYCIPIICKKYAANDSLQIKLDHIIIRTKAVPTLSLRAFSAETFRNSITENLNTLIRSSSSVLESLLNAVTV